MVVSKFHNFIIGKHFEKYKSSETIKNLLENENFSLKCFLQNIYTNTFA